MYDKKVFAKNLEHYMKLHGENQADIARVLGISKSNVTAYLAGRQIPRMDKVQTLAEHFGINNSDLLEAQDHTEPILSRTELQLIEKYRHLSDEGQAFIRDNIEYALSRYPLTQDTSLQNQAG